MTHTRILSWFGLGLAPLACARTPDAPSRVETVHAAPTQSAGSRLYVDPVTGRFVEPAAGVVVDPPSAQRQAAAPALSERPGARGGFVVNLQGRHASHVRAEIQPDGGVAIGCDHEAEPTK